MELKLDSDWVAWKTGLSSAPVLGTRGNKGWGPEDMSASTSLESLSKSSRTIESLDGACIEWNSKGCDIEIVEKYWYRAMIEKGSDFRSSGALRVQGRL